MSEKMRGLVLKDEEVRALMRDGVVVVRRVIKPMPCSLGDVIPYTYGKPGERRFVKETFCKLLGQTGVWIDTDYRATYKHGDRLGDSIGIKKRWRSAMHMTRELSRTHTECTTATAEQVGGVWFWVATHKRITE